jgi:hypothetical protein
MSHKASPQKTRSDRSNTTCRALSPLIFPAMMFLLLPSLMQGQNNFGTVVGTVTDSSGAILANAKVTLKNIGTNVVQTTTSSRAGIYTFPSVLPGSYTESVSLATFKTFSRSPVDVQIGGSSRVDAVLQIGDVNETVTVTGATPDLQTDSSSLSTVIEGNAVLQTPINGRNVNNLLQLIPGVIVGGSTTGNPIGNTTEGSITNAIAYGNYQIGGGFGGQSAFFIDGVQANVSENNTNALIPTQDAVQEFRVYTNDVSAEFGGFGGGVVNLGTKSGASQFHGTAYNYFRNSALNANDWFSNHAGLIKPPLRQNQFGANASGPVLHGNTFFFAGWETEQVRSGYASYNTIPTVAEVSGNFSGIADIYNLSATGHPQFECNGVLNVICPSLLDPAAVTIVQTLYPINNPTSTGTTNNYVVLAKTGGNQNQYNARIDRTIGNNDSLFVRYTYWNPESLPSDPFGTKQGVGISGSDTHQAIIGNTFTLNPKTVLDGRVSYLRFYMYQVPLSRGYDITQFGSAYESLATTFGPTELPALSIGGIAAGATNSQLFWTNNAYTISGSVTRIEGRHSLKFGALVRQSEWYTLPNNQGLTFTSTSAFTEGPSGTGNALASFLLGFPSTTSVVQVGGAHQFLHNYGFYVTDTYQATQKLTINLGARWDQPGAYTEKNNWATIFAPNASSGLGSFTIPSTGTNGTVKGNLDYVDTPAYPSRRDEPLHWLLFAPRVGFAYRATNSMVAHAGYGLSYLPSTLSQDGPTSESINSSTTSLSNIAGSSTLTTIGNPLPNGIVQPIRRNPAELSELLGQAIYSSTGYQPYAYVQQWNLALERAFTKTTTLTVAYAGAKGTHLLLEGNGTQSRLNLNQLSDQYLSFGSALTTKVANPFYGQFTAGPLTAATVAQGLLLMPFPQYQQVYEQVPHLGGSTYNALQASLIKRFNHGGYLSAAYTFSKILSNTDSVIAFLDGVEKAGELQDNNNLKDERSISLQDIPQNLVVNYGIDLPFGRNQRFLHNAPLAIDELAGGWKVTGISAFHSGQPLAILNASTTLSSSFGAGQIRPNYVPGCQRQNSGSSQSRVDSWFNTSCFTAASALAFGTESRVDPVLRAASAANWDFSAMKTASLEHRMTLQFSADFFNMFNRAQFAPPDTSLADASSTYDQVTSQLNSPRNIQFSLRLSF